MNSKLPLDEFKRNSLKLVTSGAFFKGISNRFDSDIIEELLSNPTNYRLAHCRQAK